MGCGSAFLTHLRAGSILQGGARLARTGEPGETAAASSPRAAHGAGGTRIASPPCTNTHCFVWWILQGGVSVYTMS
jgi:hypothetical protein